MTDEKKIARAMVAMLNNPSICINNTIDGVANTFWVNRRSIFRENLDNNEIYQITKEADERLRRGKTASKFYGSLI